MSPMVSVNLGCVLWALHLRHKFGFAVWHQKCREFGAQPSVQKLRLLSLAVLCRCFRSSSSIDALFSTRFSTRFSTLASLDVVWQCSTLLPALFSGAHHFRCCFRFQIAAELWSGLGTSQLSPGWVGKCPIFGTCISRWDVSQCFCIRGLRRCPFSNCLINR